MARPNPRWPRGHGRDDGAQEDDLNVRTRSNMLNAVKSNAVGARIPPMSGCFCFYCNAGSHPLRRPLGGGLYRRPRRLPFFDYGALPAGGADQQARQHRGGGTDVPAVGPGDKKKHYSGSHGFSQNEPNAFSACRALIEINDTGGRLGLPTDQGGGKRRVG
jgi:hypothetical protein